MLSITTIVTPTTALATTVTLTTTAKKVGGFYPTDLYKISLIFENLIY